MTTTQDIRIPDLDGAESVEVIEVLTSVGDTISVDDSLLTLESDKASMELPAAQAGVIQTLTVSVGDTVSSGDVIGTIEVIDSATTAPANPASSAAEEPTSSEPDASTVDHAEPAADSAVTMDVTVPDIGDVTDVQVIEILVNIGDTIAVDQSVVTLESDKASMEIPSPIAGIVTDIAIALDDVVSAGARLLTVSTDSAAPLAPTKSAAANKPAAPAAPAAATTTEPATKRNSSAGNAASPTARIDDDKMRKAHASPGVRRYAREHGADLSLITGSGRKGRILRDDVREFIKKSMEGAASTYGNAQGAVSGGSGIPPLPEVDFSKFGEVERVEMGRINKLSAQNLHRAWLNLPMVTHHEEGDITDMEAFRQELKATRQENEPKVTGLAFQMKALVQSLKAFPKLNSSLSADGQALFYKKYFHIGIAVDTPNGLVVPVFKDVDKKSVYELAVEMADMSSRARKKKLKPSEMQGASMTISSLGGIGGTGFTPIINPPEVAILGISRAKMQPVWNGQDFAPRLMCPFALTYDHRVVDGADAARFMAHYVQTIGDIRRLLL